MADVPLKAMKNYATSATSHATTRYNPAFKFCVLADGPLISWKILISCYVVMSKSE